MLKTSKVWGLGLLASISILFLAAAMIWAAWSTSYHTIHALLLVADLLLFIGITAGLAIYLQLRNSNQRLSIILDGKAMRERETNHELRGPLDHIYGISQLLDEKSDPETLRYVVPQLKKSAKLLVDYLEYSLQYSRFEVEGNIKPILGYFDLRDCIGDILMMLGHRTYAIDIKLELFLANDLPSLIYSDRIMIMQIVGNLLSNAIKFSKNRFDVVKLFVKSANNEIIIVVEDTGKGINKNIINKVFEPFVTTFNTHKSGTGIGLSLTRKHAEKLGGTITVNSTEGKGSTFTVKLPLLIGEHRI